LTAPRNAEVASARMRVTREERRHVRERLAEAFREVGVLWLTFALLDRLVSGTLTFPWVFVNGTWAIATWSLGLYIELRRPR